MVSSRMVERVQYLRKCGRYRRTSNQEVEAEGLLREGLGPGAAVRRRRQDRWEAGGSTRDGVWCSDGRPFGRMFLLPASRPSPAR